jgi:hypothetical protein
MISLKRNKYGEFMNANGLRKGKWVYDASHSLFKLSRSKFDDFMSCKRCFYLDRVLGIKTPGMPSWALNNAVDQLLKHEFDFYRKEGVSHPVLQKKGYGYIKPYIHDKLDEYRDALHGGLQYKLPNSNILLSGGIDDLWINTKNNKVVIADYKAQAKEREVTIEGYLSDMYHQGYKKQLEFYAFLLEKNNFSVHDTGFFYVANGRANNNMLIDSLHFDIHIIPYTLDLEWIEPALIEMLDCLNSKIIPEPTPHCENCAFNSEVLKLAEH